MNLQESQFYLVVPPGLEHLSLEELQLKWSLIVQDLPLPEIRLNPGGLEFKTNLLKGCLLNYYLKIPTRILLVFGEFKCRDFPKLFKKISKLSWRNYLIGQTPEIKVSSKNSKLFDSRRITETIQEALKKYYKGQPPKEKDVEKIPTLPPTGISVRFQDDLCTISIDTGGEPLFKRAYRPFIEKAPLRENLASALILKLKSSLNEVPPIKLIDPMCGSGTFLIEAGQFFKPNTSRDYSFLHFPCLKPSFPVLLNSLAPPLFQEKQGFDKDPKAIETCERNNEILNQNIAFKVQDLLAVSDLDKSEKLSKSIIICNPPYGERIKTNKDPIQFLNEALLKMVENYNPLMIGILFPQEKCSKIQFPSNYKINETLKLKNGGLEVAFLILIKK